MSAKLSFKYDRAADILHIDKCPPYDGQESEELGDEIIARLNPKTGEVENLEVLSPRHGCCVTTFSSYRCPANCASRPNRDRVPQATRDATTRQYRINSWEAALTECRPAG
jgi:uncharacterized protein YuzE